MKHIAGLTVVALMAAGCAGDGAEPTPRPVIISACPERAPTIAPERDYTDDIHALGAVIFADAAAAEPRLYNGADHNDAELQAAAVLYIESARQSAIETAPGKVCNPAAYAVRLLLNLRQVWGCADTSGGALSTFASASDPAAEAAVTAYGDGRIAYNGTAPKAGGIPTSGPTDRAGADSFIAQQQASGQSCRRIVALGADQPASPSTTR